MKTTFTLNNTIHNHTKVQTLNTGMIWLMPSNTHLKTNSQLNHCDVAASQITNRINNKTSSFMEIQSRNSQKKIINQIYQPLVAAGCQTLRVQH